MLALIVSMAELWAAALFTKLVKLASCAAALLNKDVRLALCWAALATSVSSRLP